MMTAFLGIQMMGQNVLNVEILPDEHWWGGVDDFLNYRISNPRMIPYSADTSLEFDLRENNYSNQAVPFMVSDKGRYVWSEQPFKVEFRKGVIIFTGDSDLALTCAGSTLREAYLHASANHFPPSGTIPPEVFLKSPQYNTWIELVYDENQEDILRYANGIAQNGFPTDAVLMIDDNWQKYYGNFEFKPDKFPDPAGMVSQLHSLGFKVMLWVCPFISPDSTEFRYLEQKGFLVKDVNGRHPYLSKWWNGYSAMIDLSNPQAKQYFIDVLKKMQKDYGIDGFKFDAGDADNYSISKVRVFDGKSYGTNHTLLWASLAREFEYNEYRACWKMGGQPIVQRLQDKKYSWDGVGRLVPCMIASGIEGHIYNCPDMVGGGEFRSFENVGPGKCDQELIVRSCQIHSMMPMMQFSVAPWRILDQKHLDICRSYAHLHSQMGDYILEQARLCSQSGEPLVRSMEYSFPAEGFATCVDQFMLGDDYLVAPMTEPGYERRVKLPHGTWRDETGRKYKGGRTYLIEVPIERLPYFVKVK